ncbi:MAG: hypothetical protein ACR2MO_10675, partial [Acidimicrobiales bacterium]
PSAAYRDALVAAGRGEPSPLVDFVAQRCAGLVDRAEEARAAARPGAAAADALQRWESRVRTAHRLQHLLAAGAEAALARHRRRADLGWMADLAAARVAAPPWRDGATRFDPEPVTIRVARGEGPAVQEVFDVTAHPVAGGGDVVRLRAVEAELDMDVRAADVAGPVPAAFTDRLDVLLDRAVTALAVRTAAEDDG